MNTEKLYEYILENFNISIDTARMIDNILCYVQNHFATEEAAAEFIYTMIESIGIEEKEILNCLEN